MSTKTGQFHPLLLFAPTREYNLSLTYQQCTDGCQKIVQDILVVVHESTAMVEDLRSGYWPKAPVRYLIATKTAGEFRLLKEVYSEQDFPVENLEVVSWNGLNFLKIRHRISGTAGVSYDKLYALGEDLKLYPLAIDEDFSHCKGFIPDGWSISKSRILIESDWTFSHDVTNDANGKGSEDYLYGFAKGKYEMVSEYSFDPATNMTLP